MGCFFHNFKDQICAESSVFHLFLILPIIKYHIKVVILKISVLVDLATPLVIMGTASAV